MVLKGVKEENVAGQVHSSLILQTRCVSRYNCHMFDMYCT